MTAYSMWERQRVETYLIFGVLGEDPETQKHGAVCIMMTFDLKVGMPEKSENKNSSKNEGLKIPFSSTGWNKEETKIWNQFLGRNLQHRMRYKERTLAAPVRWSASHFCMQDERIYHVIRAVIVAMMPSNIRSCLRTLTGSYLECIYQLQQFGIPIKDIPGPSAKGILVKTKTLARFIKCRATIDDFRKDADPDTFAFTCPGTDCPGSNCVVFGDRMTYSYQANVTFRDYLRSKEQLLSMPEEQQAPPQPQAPTFLFGTKSKQKLDAKFLDEIIDELCGMSIETTREESKLEEEVQEGRFRFATYDKDAGWYRYIDPLRDDEDRKELRKRISQTMRDDRKRMLKSSNPEQQALPLQQEVSKMGVDATVGFGKKSNPCAPCLDQEKLDAKRFKSNHCWSGN